MTSNFSHTLSAMFSTKVKQSDIKSDGIGLTMVGKPAFAGVPITWFKTTDYYPIKMKSGMYKTSKTIGIQNNPRAGDVSGTVLMSHVENSSAGRRQYIAGEFMCGDFSLMLHNTLEANGIRCAYIIANLMKGTRHALCAFNTTDSDVIFIDMTIKNKIYMEDTFREKYAPKVKNMQFLV
jgi:hypothetical protein